MGEHSGRSSLAIVSRTVPPAPRSGGSMRKRRLAEGVIAAGGFLVSADPSSVLDPVFGGNLRPGFENWDTSLLGALWCVGPDDWRDVPEGLRQRCIVDLIDRPVVNRLMLCRASLALAWRPVGMSRAQALRRFAAHARGAARGARLERQIRRAGSRCAVANGDEAKAAGYLWVANGYDEVEMLGRGSVDRFVIPASFRYEPNLDGAGWFIRRVAPLMRDSLPGRRVCFAGASANRVERLAQSIGAEVLSDPDQMSEVFSPTSAVVVPLRFGTGTRIKIIEAWAHGYPVVTTTKGAEGLGAIDGVDVLIADSPRAFAAACHRLATDPALAQALRDAGRVRFERDHQWADIGTRLVDALRAEA